MSGLLNSTGAVSGILGTTVGTPAAGGITHASQWRISSGVTTTGTNVLTANWEVADLPADFGAIGTAMTESSGIFTFPVTGIWHVKVQWYGRAVGSARLFAEIYIKTTTDDSSYAVASVGITSVYTDLAYAGVKAEYIFDVTNTTTHKVLMQTGYPGNTQTNGDSSAHYSGLTFIRLGDT